MLLIKFGGTAGNSQFVSAFACSPTCSSNIKLIFLLPRFVLILDCMSTECLGFHIKCLQTTKDRCSLPNLGISSNLKMGNKVGKEKMAEIQTSKPKTGNEEGKEEIPEIQTDLLEKGTLIGRFVAIVFCAS